MYRRIAYLLVVFSILAFPSVLCGCGCRPIDSRPEKEPIPDGVFDPYLDACVQGEKFIDEGKYGEARMAYGELGIEMSLAIKSRITTSVEICEDEKGIELCKAYFNHFPYYPDDLLSGYDEQHRWLPVGETYTKLLNADPEKHGARASEETAAFNRFKASFVLEDLSRRPELRWLELDEVIDIYPNTYTCGVVIYSRYLCETEKELHKVLTKLAGNTVPCRNRIIARLVYLDSFSLRHFEEIEESLAEYVEVCRWFAETTTVEFEKALAQYWIANATRDPGLYREFIWRYPDIYGYTSKACARLVEPLLREGLFNDASRLISELDNKVGPHANTAEALLEIADAYARARRPDKAIDTYREIIARWPTEEAATAARTEIAYIHREKGRTREALEIYREIVALPDVGQRMDIIDAIYDFHAAYEHLVLHNINIGNYEKALEYLDRWAPRCFCATCIGEMQDDESEMRALCLLRLGQVEKAADILELSIIDKDRLSAPDLDFYCLLIDVYGEMGKHDKVAARLKDLERSRFYKKLMAYLDLSRHAEHGRIENIWQALEEYPPGYNPFPWFRRDKYWLSGKAAELLVSIPEKARPFVMDKFQGGFDRPEYAATILARMGAAEIEPALKERIERNFPPNETAETYLRILFQLGTGSGLGYVRTRAAEDGEDYRKFIARKVLYEEGLLDKKPTAIEMMAAVHLAEVSLGHRHLEGYLEFLRTETDADIVVDDFVYIEKARDITLALEMKDVSAKRLFEAILENTGLAFVLFPGGVVVTTEAGATTFDDCIKASSGAFPLRMDEEEISIFSYEGESIEDVIADLAEGAETDIRIDASVFDERTEESMRVYVDAGDIYADDAFLLLMKLKRLKYDITGGAITITPFGDDYEWDILSELAHIVVPLVDFQEETLDTIVGFLAAVIPGSIFIDDSVFEEEKDDIPTTLGLSDINVRDFLDEVVKAFGLTYVTDRSIIVITTTEGAKTYGKSVKASTGRLPEAFRQTSVPQLDFDNYPFDEAIEYIADITGLDIRIDPAVFETRANNGLRLTLYSEYLLTAKDLFLLVLKLKRLRYAVEDEVIMIKLLEE